MAQTPGFLLSGGQVPSRLLSAAHRSVGLQPCRMGQSASPPYKATSSLLFAGKSVSCITSLVFCHRPHK